jgi:hypothetical protein
MLGTGESRFRGAAGFCAPAQFVASANARFADPRRRCGPPAASCVYSGDRRRLGGHGNDVGRRSFGARDCAGRGWIG